MVRNKMSIQCKSVCVLFLAFLFLTVSWTETKKKELSSEKNCFVDVKKYSSAETFFSDYSYVRLETTSSCLLGSIDKLVVFDKNYYIQSQDRIFCFDASGKLVFDLQKQGHGRGEYLSIRDFDVYDSVIYVLSRAQKTLLMYDLKGDFIKEIKLDGSYENMKVFNQELLFLSTNLYSKVEYNYVVFDYKKNKVVRRFDPYKLKAGCGFLSFNAFASKSANGYYVLLPFDYTVYELTPDNLTRVFSFKFNTEVQLPENSRELPLWTLRNMMNNKKGINYFYSFNRVGKTNFISYNYLIPESGGYSKQLSRIREDGAVNTYRFGKEQSETFPYCFRPIKIKDDKVYSIVPAFNVLNREKIYKLHKFKDLGVKSDDNPILFIHKLKK